MLDEQEIRRILGISFFDINQDQYEKYQEKIDLIIEIGNCLLEAEYNAKEWIKDNAENEEDEKMTFISEGVKIRSKFLRNTGNKFDQKDVLICLEELQESDLCKNIYAGLTRKQENGVKVNLKEGN